MDAGLFYGQIGFGLGCVVARAAGQSWCKTMAHCTRRFVRLCVARRCWCVPMGQWSGLLAGGRDWRT